MEHLLWFNTQSISVIETDVVWSTTVEIDNWGLKYRPSKNGQPLKYY